MRRETLCAVAFVLTLIAAPPLDAAPTYYAEVDFAGSETSSTAEVTRNLNALEGPTSNGNYGQLELFARSGPSGLGGSAHANLYLPQPSLDNAFVSPYGLLWNNNGDRSISRRALARYTIDDLVISGPVAAGTFVPATLNLDLDGALGANAVMIGGGTLGGVSSSATARATVSVGVNFFGAGMSASEDFLGSINRFHGVFMNADGTQRTTTTVNGSIFNVPADGFDGDVDLTTPEVFLPVGVPFSLTLRFETAAEARTTNGLTPSFFNAEAQASFTDSLLFSTSGPVFGLPNASYTANSPAAGIVDNRVPEPASATLLVASFSAIALARRRRRQRHDRR